MSFLLEPGVAIYMALAVALAVWLGIFVFLWRIDRVTRELRRRLDQEAPPEAPAPRATLEARTPQMNAER
ncbi:MAG TPA: CcmD family protein [Roseiflexaceae bacterium]|nr:CcmD family protein [Roseiflexaceae bacterium]